MSTLLSKFVEQYHQRHKTLPEKIVVAPIAALKLAVDKNLPVKWAGVPIEMRLFESSEVVAHGPQLGIFVKDEGQQLRLVACDLS